MTSAASVPLWRRTGSRFQVAVPKALVLAAARLKALHPISTADAIAAETAIRAKAPLVTGDPDFKRFVGGGELEVEWIGA